MTRVRATPEARHLDPSWPLRPVRSTPSHERLDITVLESGSRTSLFVGKPSGECVGVLEGKNLDALVDAVLTRRGRRDGRPLGLAMSPEGRQDHRKRPK